METIGYCAACCMDASTPIPVPVDLLQPFEVDGVTAFLCAQHHASANREGREACFDAYTWRRNVYANGMNQS